MTIKLSRDFAVISGFRVWMQTNDSARAETTVSELAEEGITAQIVRGRCELPGPNRAYDCLGRP